jgi:hypothetical protein
MGGVTLRAGTRAVIAAVAPGALYALCGWGILVYRGGIAGALFADKDADEERATPPPATWEGRAYRLGFSLIGVWVLASSMPSIIWRLAQLLEFMRSNEARLGTGDIAFATTPHPAMWVNVVAYGIHAAFAAYLAVGAPHLRRWLSKRAVAEDGGPAMATAQQDGDRE